MERSLGFIAIVGFFMILALVVVGKCQLDDSMNPDISAASDQGELIKSAAYRLGQDWHRTNVVPVVTGKVCKVEFSEPVPLDTSPEYFPTTVGIFVLRPRLAHEACGEHGGVLFAPDGREITNYAWQYVSVVEPNKDGNIFVITFDRILRWCGDGTMKEEVVFVSDFVGEDKKDPFFKLPKLKQRRSEIPAPSDSGADAPFCKKPSGLPGLLVLQHPGCNSFSGVVRYDVKVGKWIPSIYTGDLARLWVACAYWDKGKIILEIDGGIGINPGLFPQFRPVIFDPATGSLTDGR